MPEANHSDHVNTFTSEQFLDARLKQNSTETGSDTIETVNHDQTNEVAEQGSSDVDTNITNQNNADSPNDADTEIESQTETMLAKREDYHLSLMHAIQAEDWTPETLAGSLELAKRVQSLQADVPTTSQNSDQNQTAWPMAYIDPTLVAKGEILSAPVPLSYLEGYPTVDGVPFWERLENESSRYYKLFKEYRDMIHIHPSRSVPRLAKQAQVHPNIIMRLGALYHWQMRCRAYDVYRQMEEQVIKTRQIESTMGRHTEMAKYLGEIAINYIENNHELMSPKNAIEALKLAVELERLSIGLSPNKAEGEVAQQKAMPTIHVTNQTLNVPGPSNDKSKQGGTDDRVAQILNVLHQSGAMQATVDAIEMGETDE